jgi:hypothetical protein
MPCNAYNAKNPVMGNILWMFYVSKILDFMDTFFIIMGKKWKQLSFLHVYHHVTIFAVREHLLSPDTRLVDMCFSFIKERMSYIIDYMYFDTLSPVVTFCCIDLLAEHTCSL